MPRAREDWFARHWKLLVLASVGVFAIFGFSIFAIVLGVLRSTPVYTEALADARVHPAVKSELGEPVEAGWFVCGSVNVSGSSGAADLTIPISGPTGSGTLFAIAEKRAGRWRFELLEVEVEGREDRIPLR